MEFIIWIVFVTITIVGHGLMWLIPISNPIWRVGLSAYSQVCINILCIYIFRQYLCNANKIQLFSKKSRKCYIWAILIGIGVCLGHRLFFLIFWNFVEQSLQEIEEAVITIQNQELFYTTVPGMLYEALLAPITEEVYCRGIIFTVARQKRGSLYAIIISSILFALVHFNGVQFISALFMGVVIGYAIILTDNVYIGIVIHIANNAFSILNGFILKKIKGIDYGYALTSISLGIILLILGFLMLWFGAYREKKYKMVR